MHLYVGNGLVHYIKVCVLLIYENEKCDSIMFQYYAKEKSTSTSLFDECLKSYVTLSFLRCVKFYLIHEFQVKLFIRMYNIRLVTLPKFYRLDVSSRAGLSEPYLLNQSVFCLFPCSMQNLVDKT